MKKTKIGSRTARDEDDVLPEYHFDYSKAKPNRFAAQLKAGARTIVLEPDVAKVFSTSESVNAVLRSLIETMPKSEANGRKRR